MRRFFVFALIPTMVLCGCQATPPHRAEFSGAFPIEDCPEEVQGRVALSTQVFELPAPPPQNNSVETIGVLGRRLVVSTTMAGLDPGDRITWSSLSISSLGGTFVTWKRLQTDFVTIDPLGDGSAASDGGDEHRPELAAVSLSPGQIKIVRSATAKANLAGTVAIDVLAKPGGVVVDNTRVHIPKLWARPGVPVPPDAVQVEVASIRYPPGLDNLEAVAELSFVLRRAKTGDEWICTAQTRLTLVTEDEIRLPLWDLGLASKNAGRGSWLGLYSPSLGLMRVIFGSAAEANALANWLQTTSATKLGDYTLGVFDQPKYPRGPSFRPVDPDALKTFRPLTAADIPSLRVGPVGEL